MQHVVFPSLFPSLDTRMLSSASAIIDSEAFLSAQEAMHLQRV
jgi:hypothetical protein